ncbi:MAG: hypothetical protein PHU77_00250 [Simplicispira sp.]|nr:hypothetical protein [Simplicispira sp.]
MNISALLDRPIAFQRPFVSIGAGITGALMLSQALYWSRRTQEDTDWFYKTQAEWEDETGLTRSEQEGARAKLSKLGVLEEMKRGIPCKLFYRVNIEKLSEILLAKLPQPSMRETSSPVCGNPANKDACFPQAGMRETSKQACGKPASRPAGFPQSISTETTTETTAETTTDILPAAAPATPLPTAALAVVVAQPAAAPAAAKPAKPTRRKAAEAPGDETELQAACRATWGAYAQAYAAQYGAAPVRNAKVNSAVKSFVQRIGHDESAAVAEFFVNRVSDALVVRGMHDFGLLLARAETFRTQWATGQSMTATRARQIDQSQANCSAADEAIALMRARRGGAAHA